MREKGPISMEKNAIRKMARKRLDMVEFGIRKLDAGSSPA